MGKKSDSLRFEFTDSGTLENMIDEPEDDPCAQAIDWLWRDIITATRPDYGNWEYPAQAYRHIKAEFDDVKKQRDEAYEYCRQFVKQLEGMRSGFVLFALPPAMRDTWHAAAGMLEEK